MTPMYTQEEMQQIGINAAIQQGTPAPTRTERAEFVDKIRVEPVLENIKHQLAMEYYDKNQEAWLEIPGCEDKRWSKFGINAILIKFTPMINVAVQGANISEELMLKRVFNFTESVLFDVGENWKEYGVKNEGMIIDIGEICMSISMSTWSQAKEGHTSRTWRETTVENRQIVTAPPEQKKGRISSILWGNK